MNNDALKKIQLIVSDFDGVMTDNKVLIAQNGEEYVYVSRADGQGVNLLKKMGIKLIILSTESNQVVKKRAEKLKVECINNVENKAVELSNYCAKRKIDLSNVAYVGNDVNDYDALKIAGIKIVPCDAYEVVKKIADYVTVASGGNGVIREVAEMIWEESKK